MTTIGRLKSDMSRLYAVGWPRCARCAASAPDDAGKTLLPWRERVQGSIAPSMRGMACTFAEHDMRARLKATDELRIPHGSNLKSER